MDKKLLLLLLTYKTGKPLFNSRILDYIKESSRKEFEP